MFFIISKIFAFFLNPLSWFFVLTISAYFIKNTKQKKRFIYAAVILLYLFSNNSLYHLANSLWIEKAVKLPGNAHYEYAIVPGGMANFDDKVQRIRFSASADRLFQAILLYKTGKVSKLFISGGSGTILYPELLESEIVKDYLIKTGIPQQDILIENRSRNTYQNAQFTARILKEKNFTDTCLLITSALHIPRATACFTKAGIKVKAYPSNQVLDKYRYSPDNLILPSAEALNNWQQLLHEIAGYFVYWLRGYI